MGSPGGVQGNRLPRDLRFLRRDAVGLQEPASLIRTVNFKALILGPVFLRQPEIVEHGTDVEQFRIIRQTLFLTAQSAKHVDAAGVIVDQLGCGITHQFCCLTG